MKANKERRTSMELVREVKNHPCLYDNELTDHGLHNSMEAAWEKVGRKLNLSGSDCRVSWMNILQKLKSDLKSSPSATPYYLKEELQFVVPFLKQEQEYLASLPATIAEVERQLEQSLQALSQLEEETNVTSRNKSVNAFIEFEPESDEEGASDSPANFSKKPSTSKTFETIVANTEPPVDDQGADDTTRGASKKVRQLVSQEKANELFLLSLLHDVDQMTEFQIQQFKRQIIELLNDIRTTNK